MAILSAVDQQRAEREERARQEAKAAGITLPGPPTELEVLAKSSPKVLAAKKKYLEQAKEMEELVKVALTDREVLLAQLAHFVLTDRQKLLVQALLASKEKPDLDIHQLLLGIPMSALEFLNILREARMAFSNYQTQEIIDKHRPKVVESAMKAAQTKKRKCSACAGTGKITTPAVAEVGKEIKPPAAVECFSCHGDGKITVLPDHERAITALEIAGVLKKGGGVAVVVNNSNNSAPEWRSSSDFRKETDKLMYGDTGPAVVDAEFVAEQVVKTPAAVLLAEKVEEPSSGEAKPRVRGVVLPKS